MLTLSNFYVVFAISAVAFCHDERGTQTLKNNSYVINNNNSTSGIEINSRFGLGFVDKVIPEPVKNIFKGQQNETARKLEEKEEKRMEHGSLDFIGRDIIRGVGKTVKTLQEKIGWTSSNETSGLDSNKTFFSGVKEKFQEAVQAIYPGTKWCGDGDKSDSYDDLGPLSDTDRCCREHDLCPINIPSGKTKYGLINTGLFTRSHCDCDRKFYNCLKRVGSLASKNIGFTYFTVLGPQCFNRNYAIKGCARKKSGKCIEYEYDRHGQASYQWFDSPTF